MDFVRPPTAWYGGRCYRVLNPLTAPPTTNYTEEDTYGYEHTVYEDEVECAKEQEEFQVEQLDNGKFQSSFPVASPYVSYLIGAKGATRRRIENETYTTLKFPGKGQNGDVVILGRDVKTVRQARIKLEMLVTQARKRAPATHFLSIPCNTTEIQGKFNEFKKQVLEKCGTNRGMEETIFLPSAKLHLTICVMVLADERERQEALQVLAKCPQEVIRQYLGGDKMRVTLKGVEIMNDDPGEVHVLYARMAPMSWSQNLQALVDGMVNQFAAAGIVGRERESVKLHMTLMNTKYRNMSSYEDSDNQNYKPRESFCARQILEEFRDFEFGTMDVDEIHLSVRHTTSKDGFYSASGTIPVLPF